VIELVAARTQTDFNVGQAFAEGQLRKGHGQELIPAAKVTHLVVTAVASDTASELLRVNPLDELRENGFARMHGRILARRISKKMRRKSRANLKSLTPYVRRRSLVCSMFQKGAHTTSG
jgi:hypothetical protein